MLQMTDLAALSQRYGHLSMAVLHRGGLHHALLSALPQSAIRLGMKCVGARTHEAGAVLRFANGHTVEADLVLACDGVHSAIRKAVFPKARERFARYTCWRAISPGIPAGFDPTRLSESWGAAGKRIGLAAIPGERIYWFACCGARRIKDPDLAKIGLTELQARFAEFHDPVPEVLASTSSDAVIWTDIEDLDPMPSFTHGRIVLLGDAAHAVKPDLGQGAGLSIEDAAVLASLLGRLPIDETLHEYDARRVGRASPRLRVPPLRKGGPVAKSTRCSTSQSRGEEYPGALHGSPTRRGPRHRFRAGAGCGLNRSYNAAQGIATTTGWSGGDQPPLGVLIKTPNIPA
ncbi:hypothetical protein HFO74_08120 [Rhizobium laguerreae]|uniref:FAD-binding domain-containing protein n=2 Tax=Rhizobium laguerreae TaxID=1076926 RepID=A0AB35FA09_9HYPH|nr:hypothetical protein [Rhizobium laguerreae]MBY3075756.1 hypothetical protein [Rhizobium laguerreae]MBY3112005.1 hypothetical protein [Rhizobium laguerreae]MBY3201245.1 hypothetical protein [Rhizobium laguerreae]MBY3244309.1 hypothetical protein [Rhizobium laguerreae]